jgi:uncharacterized caspase-like protein
MYDATVSDPIMPGSSFQLCASIDGYYYSGRSQESIYAVLLLKALSTPSARGNEARIFRLMHLGDTEIGRRPDSPRLCANILAPDRPGQYRVLYHPDPMFIPFRPVRPERLHLEESVRRQLATIRAEAFQLVTQIGVFSAGQVNIVETYLKVNSQYPSSNPVIQPGYSAEPVRFSWHVRGDSIRTQHRYRLYPEEKDWSEWSDAQNIDYFFILPGYHVFEVATRYFANSDWHVAGIADYRFTLDAAYVAEPKNAVIAKATFGATREETSRIDIERIYSLSRALLIGVSTFQDASFPPLPFVKNDLDAMEVALKSAGFNVNKPTFNGTREDIMLALSGFVQSAKDGERLILYFSTHGFADPIAPGKAYLASRDCLQQSPDVKCIPLRHIEDMVERATHAGVRHVLVILDACAAGLGVISKTAQREFFEQSLALKPGAHMLTAGLAGQDALMDQELGKSYFTHYLSLGLAGESDYTGDGVISVTELLLYVRAKVAERSKGKQTPMLGRISGPGEMMFRPMQSR